MTQRGSSRPGSSKQDKPIIIKRGSIRVQIYRQKRVVAGVEYHQHVVVWVDATGKRIRKTFSDLTSATALAEQTATALSRGDWAASTFTGTDASIYADACERVARFRVSLTEAISEFEAARSKLPSGVSLIEVVSDYLQRHPIGAVQKPSRRSCPSSFEIARPPNAPQSIFGTSGAAWGSLPGRSRCRSNP